MRGLGRSLVTDAALDCGYQPGLMTAILRKEPTAGTELTDGSSAGAPSGVLDAVVRFLSQATGL